MARIAGINIPQCKVVHVALTYIHGIGKKYSNDILEFLNKPFLKERFIPKAEFNSIYPELLLLLSIIKLVTNSLSIPFILF